jgi:anti-sigma factor RsiW
MNDKTDFELKLHAYVDGNLDDEEMGRIEAYLQDNPDAAKRVWDYLHQKDDIRRFALKEVLGDAAPATYRLGKTLAKRLQPPRKQRGKRMLAVAFVFFAGWLFHAIYAPLVSNPGYTEEVVQAHLMSSSDPTEVPPISPQRLSRLFARIGELERLPDLRSFGFEPMGAQLLPSDEGVVLHIPYRGESGAVISYFLLHREDEAEMTPHHLQQNGIHVVYWQHDHSRYALAAPLPEDQMTLIASFIDSPTDPL